MSEERGGWMGGARRGLRFYARCAREAWRRSWDVSNAWPTLLVVLLASAGAWLAGADLAYAGEAYGAPVGAALFIALAWLAVFLVQFVTAPPRLYAQLDADLLALTRRLFAPSARSIAALPGPAAARITVLPPVPSTAAQPVIALPGPGPGRAPAPAEWQPEPPPEMPARPAPRPALPAIELRLHDQIHETTVADATGALLPASRAYVARVTNRGDKRVRRCQIFFANPTHIQVVSGPFDLEPGEHRDLPVLRVMDEADEPHALLYFLDAETWQVAQGQAAWLPEPGRFRVKVLSANAATAALDVTLSCSAGSPLAWTLVESSRPDAARSRRPLPAWAPSDTVAEPGAGD